MLSLLMSTYNGEKFIEQQLNSILNQSLPLDEVIIIDDCSTDKTVQIINDFIKRNNLINSWIVIKNNINRGWKFNFFYGIEKTRGDIIFFSDQDDIWHPDKVKYFNNIFIDNEFIDVVASKEELYFGGEYKFKKLSNSFVKIGLDDRCVHYRMEVSGCAMAIRKSFYNKVKSYYTQGQAHDEFFWQMGQAFDSLALISDRTILHRIHGGNESRKKSFKLDRISWCIGNINSIDNTLRCLEYYKNEINDYKIKILALNGRKELFRARLLLLTERKINMIFKLFFDKYHIYARKRQLFKDIMCAFGFLK